MGKIGNVTSKSRLGKDVFAFCHENGHWKKDSPKLKKKDKDKSISYLCVIERRGDFSDYEFCLIGHQTIDGFDEWILDMSCTYHMYPLKEWFFNFEEVDSGTIYMGSGDVTYITGISSIQLRNHDGSTRVLIDVRYVPNLKKNLISLRPLESKGLVVIIRDRVLKVISGALLVMKAMRGNNLYYYDGSIVTRVRPGFLIGMKIKKLLVWGM